MVVAVPGMVELNLNLTTNRILHQPGNDPGKLVEKGVIK
jgi:hypothetical protein